MAIAAARHARRIAARCRATPAFRLQPGDALLLFFKDNVPLRKADFDWRAPQGAAAALRVAGLAPALVAVFP